LLHERDGGMTSRPLTPGEINLAASIFGAALDLTGVTIKRKKWWPLQPRKVLMAPTGHVHVHPRSDLWSDDYSSERLSLQGLLLHELTHVYQTQKRGRYYLPIHRHPLCQYGYAVKPGQPFHKYGIEQQAEIVRHVFLLRNHHPLPGAPPLSQLESILPFR
jgi:hypothetical protein